MDNPVYIVIGLLVLIILILIGVCIWQVSRPKLLTPRAETLRTWVAEQLRELTDGQKEAVELYCWSQRTEWNLIAENVNLGVQHPHAKEALHAVQS